MTAHDHTFNRNGFAAKEPTNYGVLGLGNAPMEAVVGSPSLDINLVATDSDEPNGGEPRKAYFGMFAFNSGSGEDWLIDSKTNIDTNTNIRIVNAPNMPFLDNRKTGLWWPLRWPLT